jgi:hypothetical protein
MTTSYEHNNSDPGFYLSIYLCIYSPFVGPWPFFQFLVCIYMYVCMYVVG